MYSNSDTDFEIKIISTQAVSGSTSPPIVNLISPPASPIPTINLISPPVSPIPTSPPASLPVSSPPRREMEKANFEIKTLYELLKNVFTYYHMNWEAKPSAKKYFMLARYCFMKRMFIAGHPHKQSLRYLHFVMNELPSTADFDFETNLDALTV